MPRQKLQIFIGLIVFQFREQGGSDRDTTRQFFLQAHGVRTEKRTCCLRSHFLPDAFMVKSAESGTGYDPQFPLLVGADCIAFHGTTVEPVVSENSIVVRQTLDTFDSFEISDLEKAHELSERWCNNVTSAGHFERDGIFVGSLAVHALSAIPCSSMQIDFPDTTGWNFWITA